jgi:hypothetical protein
MVTLEASLQMALQLVLVVLLGECSKSSHHSYHQKFGLPVMTACQEVRRPLVLQEDDSEALV